jgi:DNA-binding XRE family transcriptional regulator
VVQGDPGNLCFTGSLFENSILPLSEIVKRAAMITKFGHKLRHLREQAGWNQSELAHHLGLSQRSKGYISEIEAGKKMPPADKIVAIANVFNVTIDYLLRDEIAIEEDPPQNL